MVLSAIFFSHLEVLELNNGHQTCCWFCFEGLPLNCLQSNRWWWFPWTLVSWMIYLHHIYSSDSEHWREKCQTYEALSFYTYVLSSSGSRNKIPSDQPGQYLTCLHYTNGWCLASFSYHLICSIPPPFRVCPCC